MIASAYGHFTLTDSMVGVFIILVCLGMVAAAFTILVIVLTRD